MPLSPQQRHHAGNPNLANGCQKLATVNLSDTPRTNLNNPEQIRTNLNIAERPDQIGRPPESPQNTPKKTTPNRP